MNEKSRESLEQQQPLSSPTTVMAITASRGSPPPLLLGGKENQGVGLPEFLNALPDTVRRRRAIVSSGGEVLNHDPIMELFEHLDAQSFDCSRYSYFDTSKNYTRNLIATDGETYTLMLLCWNPGMKSPIHDHPCDGCWMRVLSGTVRERRFVENSSSPRACSSGLVCTQDRTFSASDNDDDGGVVFIEDSMGYHSVGNPSVSTPAMTLHLYCPPFQKCHIWMDEQKSKPLTSSMCYYSEYGQKV